MKHPESSLYPAFAAVAALLLTAAAISASIIYVYRSDNKVKEIAVSEMPTPKTELYIDSFERSGSFTTPYGTFTPIESVLDINEYMTTNPVILTEEETLPYICGEGGDPDEVRRIIRELSDGICSEAVNDSEKAEAIAMWVGMNVAYDFDAGENSGDLSVTNLEAIISNNFRTTCGGFANLYSALCSAQGIKVLNMKGGTSSDGYTRAELETAPANHEWNGVKLDGKWYYSDSTWISDLSFSDGALSGGTEIKSFYALFSFGEMSVEHRIDRCEYRDYGFENIN
ncbi:MAG: hypothetical protein MSJ26_09585 [Oscillospiraceae bacterium]|nr:hypothetical protein [Oscillospiraceae bacterium]